MSEELVGEFEKLEIRKQVDRMLRDLGNPVPPINLKDVRSLLSLDLHYYSSSDPTLLQELRHRFTLLAQKAIPDIGRHLISALAKSNLCAFWVPEASRIWIDSEVPTRKHRWIEAHEITHSVTPWHKGFLLGDNKFTLDPECHAIIEAEANYGAGRLLFLQDRFASEARDLRLSFDSIKALAKRYNNSIVSTLWRTVEERDPEWPVFGMVSYHPHFPEIGRHDGSDPWRYFIRSRAFRREFGSVSPDDIFALIVQFATTRKTGPIFSAQDLLQDGSGDDWEFSIESFSTKHALLTLGYAVAKRPQSIQSIGAVSAS